MRKLLVLINSSVLMLSSLSAFAADMPVKAQPVPVVVDSWTGFYAGLNAGGTWGGNHLTATPADPGTTPFWAPCFAAGACPRDYGRSNSSSGEVGGQIGYNWQVTSIVLGVESDIQWAPLRSATFVGLANTGSGFVPFNGTETSNLDWFGTTRGRLGFLIQPSVLLYGTGGVAYGAISNSWNAIFAPPANQIVHGYSRDTKVGWVAGAGGEWKINRNWIVGLEYLHMEFDGRSFGATGVGSLGCTAADCNFNVHADTFKTDTIRARVSYQFGGPFGGPIVAKD